MTERAHGNHEVHVGDFRRNVPLVEVSSGTWMAYLDFLCDRDLVSACAAGLAEQLSQTQFGCLVAPATGAIPLCFAVAELMDVPYVILVKSKRQYMKDAITTSVRSVAALETESLLLEERYVPLLKACSPVVLLDTVTTSGATIEAMTSMMKACGTPVAAKVVAFVEGHLVDSSEFVHLGTLPIFRDGQGESRNRLDIPDASNGATLT